MAFVVTAGQVRSVRRTPGMYAHAPASVQMSPTLTMTYEHIWRAQPAVRTVVGFLARNVAQLGVDVFRRVSATDRVKLHDHPVARLLERPAPGSTWTKFRLLSHIMHELCIFDNAYLLKLRQPDDGLALMPVSARLMRPIGGSWYAPSHYAMQGGADVVEIPADGVVHIHGYNPDDPRQGVSPIETLRQILAEEHAATFYREQMWNNGARTGGVIERPKDAPPWSDVARDRFTAQWRNQWTGDSATAGGTPVLEDGMKWVASGMTPRDAQYVESRKLTREECAVAYHVPPAMLGVMDGVNFSSITEMHRMLYQDSLAPTLTQIAQDLERQVLEDIDPASAIEGSVYIEFNLHEKLRGSFAEQARGVQSAVGAPWMTRDEARGMFNLPHIDGAEDLIVPLNVIAGGLASPNDTAPDQPSEVGRAGKAALAAFLAIKRRSVLSRLGAGAAHGIDASKWTDELATHARTFDVENPDVFATIAAKHVATEIVATIDGGGDVPGTFDRLMRECAA